MAKEEIIAVGTTAASTALGSITIATVPVAVTTTVPAAGFWGWLGYTTTATTVAAAPVTVPIAAVVGVGALLTYGGYKAYKYLKNKEISKQ